MLAIYRVHGESMYPKLSGGDYIIATRFFFRLKKNDIVVAIHPAYGMLIKRILKIDDNGYWLAGDNPQSVSTEKMGPVTRNQIIGKQLFSIRRKSTATH